MTRHSFTSATSCLRLAKRSEIRLTTEYQAVWQCDCCRTTSESPKIIYGDLCNGCNQRSLFTLLARHNEAPKRESIDFLNLTPQQHLEIFGSLASYKPAKV